ncbi:unnamed protein product [Taenia asiatica]|uniref:Tetraspanin n=1 Tax=Taenia asiatica TaxID=60517 RepID=A0A0R3VTD5_TAEAS|nr:unnamed protein product [Taenia asiatica]
MGRATSRGFEIVFRIITTILLLIFLLTAGSGVLMKTSTNMLQSMVMMAFKEYGADTDDLHQITAFLIKTSNTMALYYIVFGVMLAILALIGLIASCRGWNKLLKIQYTSILIVFLAANVLVVAMTFSDPIKSTNGTVSLTEALLESYGDESEAGKKSTTIWDALMKINPQCCGMDGYEDFEELDDNLPLSCCNITTGVCNSTTAESAGVNGCRSKVESIASLKYRTSLYVSIVIISMQTLLIVLVMLLICAAKNEEESKV